MKTYRYEVLVAVEVDAENCMIAECAIKGIKRPLILDDIMARVRTASNQWKSGGEFRIPSYASIRVIESSIKRLTNAANRTRTTAME